jgi:hypothetical protein
MAQIADGVAGTRWGTATRQVGIWEASQRHHGRRFSLTQASFPSLLSLTLDGGSAVLPQPLKRRDSTLGGIKHPGVYWRLTAKKDWDRLLPGRAQGNLESDGIGSRDRDASPDNSRKSFIHEVEI